MIQLFLIVTHMEIAARYEQGVLVGGVATRTAGARPARRPRPVQRRRSRISEAERRSARHHIAEMRAILAALHPEERQAS